MSLSQGGWLKGPPLTITLEAIGDCSCGFPLFRLDGGRPEHVITQDMRWRIMLGMINCPVLRNEGIIL